MTKYQLHSPFVFELAQEVLDDDRWYYAFRDVEQVREQMLHSDLELEVTDFGAGAGPARRPLRQLARRAASSPVQGRMLFRLANRLAPKTMLELGASVGVGAMYLASAVRSARLITLEGCPECARVARTNLGLLELRNAEVVTGEFGQTLPAALEHLKTLDLVFIDGNHRAEPTLGYFENCLPYSHERTVFVFDDVYWSSGMKKAWQSVQNHARVTLTIDFFDLSLAFIDPGFREKQHFRVVPAYFKPWKVF